jgi:hypothetical protein
LTEASERIVFVKVDGPSLGAENDRERIGLKDPIPPLRLNRYEQLHLASHGFCFAPNASVESLERERNAQISLANQWQSVH